MDEQRSSIAERTSPICVSSARPVWSVNENRHPRSWRGGQPYRRGRTRRRRPLGRGTSPRASSASASYHHSRVSSRQVSPSTSANGIRQRTSLMASAVKKLPRPIATPGRRLLPRSTLATIMPRARLCSIGARARLSARSSSAGETRSSRMPGSTCGTRRPSGVRCQAPAATRVASITRCILVTEVAPGRPASRRRNAGALGPQPTRPL